MISEYSYNKQKDSFLDLVFQKESTNTTEQEGTLQSEDVIKRNGKLHIHKSRSKCDQNLQRQTLEELKLNTPEIFKEKHFLSEGTFGKVYRAKIGDKLFALKKIKVDDTK